MFQREHAIGISHQRESEFQSLDELDGSDAIFGERKIHAFIAWE
jgi:hypothetical protein